MRAKDKAVHLVKKHETNCPFSIAKNKGIIVMYQDLGSAWGHYFMYKRVPIININSNLDPHTQRIVCAHELGHAVLHRDINTSFMRNHTLLSVDKIEVEANTFAAHLLIPDIEFTECYEQITFNDIASIHNVPIELVELRCKRLF